MNFPYPVISRRTSVEILVNQQRYTSSGGGLSPLIVIAWCGNGRAVAIARKAFKLYELRLHYEPEEKVFADLWKALATDTLQPYMRVNFAKYVTKLYGERKALLRQHAEDILSGYKGRTPHAN